MYSHIYVGAHVQSPIVVWWWWQPMDNVLAVAANVYALSLPFDDHMECMSGLPLRALLSLFDPRVRPYAAAVW